MFADHVTALYAAAYRKVTWAREQRCEPLLKERDDRARPPRCTWVSDDPCRSHWRAHPCPGEWRRSRCPCPLPPWTAWGPGRYRVAHRAAQTHGPRTWIRDWFFLPFVPLPWLLCLRRVLFYTKRKIFQVQPPMPSRSTVLLAAIPSLGILLALLLAYFLR